MRNRIEKKLFGLGVSGAAFLGGAGFGYSAGLLSYSILHRYFFIRNAMFEKGLRTDGWKVVNYKDFYLRNECFKGCPENSNCVWGYCECYSGYIKFRGKCYKSITVEMMENVTNTDRFGKRCNSKDNKDMTCSEHDINFICGDENICRCRDQMKYNPSAQECQIQMDLNCGNFTYDSPVSLIVKEAADAAKKQIEESSIITERTETIEESLDRSLLKFLKLEEANEKDLEEAFCRDIDSFNAAFITDDGSRPANCPEVNVDQCAILYDSDDCTGGWSLSAQDGTQMNFYYFSSNWKYRNDLNTIGLRFGCTFTGFSDTGFTGNKMIVTADITDRWIVLSSDDEYKDFHKDIESFQCTCRH